MRYKLLLYFYAISYTVAYINHFISTKVYYEIMLNWLPV